MLRLNDTSKDLSEDDIKTLETMWIECTDDILHSTSLAACGHPGGSMSSLNFLLMMYAMSDITPENIHSSDRDRVLISHGHISPGVYSVLGQYGFFNREDMILNFRKTGSMFSGHVETGVPGVEWNTGNLGQGVSAACGMALAHKIKGQSHKTIVCMGDGEQQKGQISEACRFASKFGLNNLIAIIDYNRYQIGGLTSDIMPSDMAQTYEAAHWNVLEIKNAHDFKDIYDVLRQAWNHDVKNPDAPTVIIAHTIMGHGVSFMSDICDFHGKTCTADEHAQAMDELGRPNRLEEFKIKRQQLDYMSCPPTEEHDASVRVNTGSPIVYGVDVMTDNRSAYGSALEDLSKLNNHSDDNTHIVGISCDLEGSVKMSAFRKDSPEYFFEGGIQEHNNAVVAGSLSKENFQVFFSTFGVFGVDEVYNQQRLNGFNHTNVKTVCTHLGLSVGEDGPTHQSIDYIGLFRNIFGYQAWIPADPNQTDHMVRHAASIYGNVFIGMGRAKTPVITNDQNEPFFGKDYVFTPGQADVIRSGNDASFIAYGPVLVHALEAAQILKDTHSLNVRVINMGSIVPCDRAAIQNAANETKIIVTVEDHHKDTGLGSIVSQIIAEDQLSTAFKSCGVDRFSYSGDPKDLYKEHGLDADSLVQSVLSLR